jgi:hypothetical protein
VFATDMVRRATHKQFPRHLPVRSIETPDCRWSNMISRLIGLFFRHSEPSLFQKCLAVHIQGATAWGARR